jgi:hypothetical protein
MNRNTNLLSMLIENDLNVQEIVASAPSLLFACMLWVTCMPNASNA